MEFKVGQITARCTTCTGTVFEEQRPESGRMHSRFRCVRCGAETRYSDLIMQIGASSRRNRERPVNPRTPAASASDAFAATIPGFIAQPRSPKAIS